MKSSRMGVLLGLVFFVVSGAGVGYSIPLQDSAASELVTTSEGSELKLLTDDETLSQQVDWAVENMGADKESFTQEMLIQSEADNFVTHLADAFPGLKLGSEFVRNGADSYSISVIRDTASDAQRASIERLLEKECSHCKVIYKDLPPESQFDSAILELTKTLQSEGVERASATKDLMNGRIELNFDFAQVHEGFADSIQTDLMKNPKLADLLEGIELVVNNAGVSLYTR